LIAHTIALAVHRLFRKMYLGVTDVGSYFDHPVAGELSCKKCSRSVQLVAHLRFKKAF
jgi:hypothetical protein